MPTKVLLTVDTELAWRHHDAGRDWRDVFARSYEAAGVGIPYQLGLLREHGLRACFFVDPMPALVHGLDPIKRMVEPILAAGQEVQLHLHPFWADLAAAGGDAVHRELADFAPAAQQALIEQARDLLVQAGAPLPFAFRAGSFAADRHTLTALAALGFRYDSSHNGSHHPHPSRLPIDSRQLVPVAIGGLIEVPVSQIEPRPGQLRHLQICALSLAEMCGALDHARCWGHPVATIVSHSFELATRDGLRVNGIARNRFARLCEWLGDRADRLPTTCFAQLGGVPLDAAARPMQGRPLTTARRVAEQVWSDARYERPGRSLTLAAASGISGLEAFAPYVL